MGIFSANVFDPNYGQQFTDAILAQPDAQKPDAPRRGGLFGRLRNDPAMGDRIRAALAMLQGDQGAAARFQQLQIERQRLGIQQQEAQRAEQQRQDQIWGLKEAGVGNPLIAAMSPSDASQTLRERFTPYTGSPGSRHVMPSLNGGADTVDATPTTDEQTMGWLNRIDPRLGTSFAAKQAVIMNQGVDPSTGQPFAQALDPQSLFPGLGQQQGASPQVGAPPAQMPPQMPPQAPPQAGPQRFQDGDREIINGIPYVRQGGRWVPSTGATPSSSSGGWPTPYLDSSPSPYPTRAPGRAGRQGPRTFR